MERLTGWLAVSAFVLISPLALLGSIGCGARVVAAPTPPSAVAVLQHDLADIFQTPQFDRSLWSVLVRNVSSDTNLFSLNSSKLVMPGSNMKILTLAAAADRLGWSYRFETRIVTGAVIEDGVLKGDVIIV